MATTIKSMTNKKSWTFYDEPHEFSDSETGWEGLRMTIDDAFEVFVEQERANDYDYRVMTREQLKRAQARAGEADGNSLVALRAISSDIYALARAMEREGWGTYLRAIERVQSYYRQCYRDRFGC